MATILNLASSLPPAHLDYHRGADYSALIDPESGESFFSVRGHIGESALRVLFATADIGPDTLTPADLALLNILK